MAGFLVKYFFALFLSLQVHAGFLDLFITLPRFQIIQVPTDDNNCFFNALRRANIDIDRARVILELERHREDPIWLQAVARLAAQDLDTLEFDNFRLRDLQQRARFNRDAVIYGEADYLYSWFIQRLRMHAPMPYERDDYEETNPVQLIDLLGEVFGFNLRITQVDDFMYRVVRNFRRNNRHPEITLLHTPGEVGHFEYLAADNVHLETMRSLEVKSKRKILSIPKVPYQYGGLCNADSLGTFGAVLEACPHSDSSQKIAIKVSLTEQVVFDEGRIHAQLQHSPWVVTLKELFYNRKGIPSLVMPQCFMDLFTALQKGLRYSRQLCAAQMILALHHLHSLGWTHNDVKLENFLVGKEGLALTDFGLSAPVGTLMSRRGTLRYAPPEIISATGWVTNSESQDHWGLGIALYMLFSRSHPFDSRGLFRDLDPQRTDLESTTHIQLMECIKALLHRNPLERWSTLQILNSDFGRNLLGQMRRSFQKPFQQQALDIAEVFAGLNSHVRFETHKKCGAAWNPCLLILGTQGLRLRIQGQNTVFNTQLRAEQINLARAETLAEALGFGLQIRLQDNRTFHFYVTDLETLHVLLDSINKTQVWNRQTH